MRNSSSPLLTPLEQEVPSIFGRFMVVIFNNDHTPFDTVIHVLMEATGCDLEEASIEAWEAHTFGKAQVHFAGEPACHAVAAMINRVGVMTEVRKEWDD